MIIVDKQSLINVTKYLREQAASIRDSGSKLPESKTIDIEAELAAQRVEALIDSLWSPSKQDPWEQTKKEVPHLWETEQED